MHECSFKWSIHCKECVKSICFTCNVADRKSAKEEANNLLMDTKKKLNERLQSAESETKKLKVCRVRLTGRLHT